MTETVLLAIINLLDKIVDKAPLIIAAIASVFGLYQNYQNSKKTDKNTSITLETNAKAADLVIATKKIDQQTNSHLDQLKEEQASSNQKIEDLQRMLIKLVDDQDSAGVLDSAIKREHPQPPEGITE